MPKASYSSQEVAFVVQDAKSGDDNTNTLFAVDKSILNRASKVNIGLLMLEQGGGGHAAVGTCQVSNDKVDDILMHLIERINADS